MTHRLRCTGRGGKPPEGAVVKSYGAERSGKGVTRIHRGMDIGVERKWTADKVSGSWLHPDKSYGVWDGVKRA